jgi:hypothetical protein
MSNNIYWINPDTDDALELMATVERALANDDHGRPPADTDSPEPADDPQLERYLAENMEALRANRVIDQGRILEAQRGRLAALLHGFQHLVRRATWWYNAPQWNQLTEFHAALVRALDALNARDRQLGDRARAREQALRTEIIALDLQIRALRYENRELERRVRELERRTEEREPRSEN